MEKTDIDWSRFAHCSAIWHRWLPASCCTRRPWAAASASLCCRLDKRKFFIYGAGTFTVRASWPPACCACLRRRRQPLGQPPPLPPVERTTSPPHPTRFRRASRRASTPCRSSRPGRWRWRGRSGGCGCVACVPTDLAATPCVQPHLTGLNLLSWLQGAYLTARGVVAHDGIRGLYKGFGTVVFGMFPARMASRAAAPNLLPSLVRPLQTHALVSATLRKPLCCPPAAPFHRRRYT